MSPSNPRSLSERLRRTGLNIVLAAGGLYLAIGVIHAIAVPLLVMGGAVVVLRVVLWLLRRRNNGW
jgi:hypothetical protein